MKSYSQFIREEEKSLLMIQERMECLLEQMKKLIAEEEEKKEVYKQTPKKTKTEPTHAELEEFVKKHFDYIGEVEDFVKKYSDFLKDLYKSDFETKEYQPQQHQFQDVFEEPSITELEDFVKSFEYLEESYHSDLLDF